LPNITAALLGICFACFSNRSVVLMNFSSVFKNGTVSDTANLSSKTEYIIYFLPVILKDIGGQNI
jgi:hypothetical protein